MRLLLVRHAMAEDSPAQRGGREDAVRPLSDAGRRQTRKIAAKLRLLERRLDQIASSGLARSDQTAELLSRAYRRVPVERQPSLAPGVATEEVLIWLQTLTADTVVAIVGHEPELGRLAGMLTAGRARRAVALKKCGVCMIEFDATPAPSAGMIRWTLTPAQIRRLKA